MNSAINPLEVFLTDLYNELETHPINDTDPAEVQVSELVNKLLSSIKVGLETIESIENNSK